MLKAYLEGGKTFSDGTKSKIYRCECGQLCEFHTGLNEHRRTVHGETENIMLGWANPPRIEELTNVSESQIFRPTTRSGEKC